VIIHVSETLGVVLVEIPIPAWFIVWLLAIPNPYIPEVAGQFDAGIPLLSVVKFCIPHRVIWLDVKFTLVEECLTIVSGPRSLTKL